MSLLEGRRERKGRDITAFVPNLTLCVCYFSRLPLIWQSRRAVGNIRFCFNKDATFCASSPMPICAPATAIKL